MGLQLYEHRVRYSKGGQMCPHSFIHFTLGSFPAWTSESVGPMYIVAL